MIDGELSRIARLALSPNWEYAQLFRYVTNQRLRMTRKQAAQAAGISIYKVDKIHRIRCNKNRGTVVYSVQEWRNM